MDISTTATSTTTTQQPPCDEECIDTVLFGRVGQGKSTLGNQLLQVGRQKKHFESGEEAKIGGFLMSDNDKEGKSVYERCEVAASNNVRVWDTPGFFSLGMEDGMTMYEANRQIVRSFLWKQLKHANKTCVHRLVYFLPERGVIKKVDGYFQEELKIMYLHFGKVLFDYMIVIATVHEDYKSMAGFTEEDYQVLRTVFLAAVKEACTLELVTCPPIVYIGSDDGAEEVFQKVINTAVIAPKHSILEISTRDSQCKRCKSTFRYVNGAETMPLGIVSCKSDEYYHQLTGHYDASKCHLPTSVNKYSTVEKFLGGLGHVATLGIPYTIAAALGKQLWPGFFNTDSACSNCKRSFGTEGCCEVLRMKGSTMIDHTP